MLLTGLERCNPTSSLLSIYNVLESLLREGNGTPFQCSCLENPMDGGAWWAAVHGVAKSWTRLSDWATERLHFHALEKEMATHSSVLSWIIPGTAEPGGLPSMGWHRVGHDWSDLAAAYPAKYWGTSSKLWRFPSQLFAATSAEAVLSALGLHLTCISLRALIMHQTHRFLVCLTIRQRISWGHGQLSGIQVPGFCFFLFSLNRSLSWA